MCACPFCLPAPLCRVSSRAALGMAVAPPASDPATLAASLGTLGRLIITHPGTVLVPVGVVTFQVGQLQISAACIALLGTNECFVRLLVS